MLSCFTQVLELPEIGSKSDMYEFSSCGVFFDHSPGRDIRLLKLMYWTTGLILDKRYTEHGGRMKEFDIKVLGIDHNHAVAAVH